jgi:adenylate cyclase class 2
MEETEVKILEIDKQKIVRTLTDLGAQKIFDSTIQTIILDTQDSQIHKKRDVLRLRKQQDTIELTYKQIHYGNTVKVAQETAVQVSNLEATLKILQALGFQTTQNMQKHRTSYMINNVRFDIDRYTGEYGFIPEFLEIEGSAQDIRDYAEKLGFQEKDCLPWSTDQLIKHYAVKKKGMI